MKLAHAPSHAAGRRPAAAAPGTPGERERQHQHEGQLARHRDGGEGGRGDRERSPQPEARPRERHPELTRDQHDRRDRAGQAHADPHAQRRAVRHVAEWKRKDLEVRRVEVPEMIGRPLDAVARRRHAVHRQAVGHEPRGEVEDGEVAVGRIGQRQPDHPQVDLQERHPDDERPGPRRSQRIRSPSRSTAGAGRTRRRVSSEIMRPAA